MRLQAVCALAFTMTAFAPAASAQSSRSTLKSKFDDMAFLAGSCWKGTFAGRTVTDEHCFEWMYDGNFLRDRHVVRGDSVPYAGETIYAWNPQQQRIVYWYAALPGFYSTGFVQRVDSNTIMFVDDLHEAAGKRDLRTVWKRTGPHSFTNKTEDVTGPSPKLMWSMEMMRSRATPRQ